jgi:hypothetical protein
MHVCEDESVLMVGLWCWPVAKKSAMHMQVGQKPSQAEYYVNDNRGTVALLSQLVAKGRQLARKAQPGTGAFL